MGFISNIFKKKEILSPYDLSAIKVDVHSHFIPGIDDGAPTVEDSVQLITSMSNLGYKKVITTPHIMSDYYKNTPEIILSGRRLNDGMGEFISNQIVKLLIQSDFTIKNSRILILGVTFKPNTDDMREAPSLVVIKALSERGATIRAYDPVATTEAQKQLDVSASVEFVDELYDAVDQSDALLLLTEWKEFRAPDFDQLEQQLISKVIFDGRNVFDPKVVAMHNLSYYSIGRRPVLAEPQ